MMQVNATRHCCVGGNLVEVPAFAGMTGNLVEVLVPAFAGMTFLRWPDSGCRHSRVGGNLLEVLVPAFAGMTFLRWDDRVVPSFSRRRESA